MVSIRINIHTYTSRMIRADVCMRYYGMPDH